MDHRLDAIRAIDTSSHAGDNQDHFGAKGWISDDGHAEVKFRPAKGIDAALGVIICFTLAVLVDLGGPACCWALAMQFTAMC